MNVGRLVLSDFVNDTPICTIQLTYVCEYSSLQPQKTTGFFLNNSLGLFFVPLPNFTVSTHVKQVTPVYMIPLYKITIILCHQAWVFHSKTLHTLDFILFVNTLTDQLTKKAKMVTSTLQRPYQIPIAVFTSPMSKTVHNQERTHTHTHESRHQRDLRDSCCRDGTEKRLGKTQSPIHPPGIHHAGGGAGQSAGEWVYARSGVGARPSLRRVAT